MPSKDKIGIVASSERMRALVEVVLVRANWGGRLWVVLQRRLAEWWWWREEERKIEEEKNEMEEDGVVVADIFPFFGGGEWVADGGGGGCVFLCASVFYLQEVLVGLSVVAVQVR